MGASFTVIASLLVLVILVRHPAPGEQHLLVTTGIKAALSALLAGAALWGLIWTRPRERGTPPGPRHCATGAGPFRLGLILTILVASCAVLPRLNVYPWTAPDELHHLIVAKNLAQYGLYASGSPGTQFNLFDSYDSVGAPVIAPVAAAFRLFGTGLTPARVVMAVYYLLMCVGLYLLFAPVVGPPVATLGLLLATIGYGSIYLGRTLYGEAPALAFFVWGLLAWRRAAFTRPWTWSALAGTAFGLAILCKTILALSAFAFLAVVVVDLLGERRLRWPQLAAPALATPAVIIAWWMVQAAARHDVANEAGDTLGLYKHYFMFGIGSLISGFHLFFSDPATSAASVALVVSLVSGLAFLTPRRYDPTLAVLALLAIFFLFWWMFFTPCHIKRYLWWTYALAAVFGARLVFPGTGKAGSRWRLLVVLPLLLLPQVPSTARELWLVYQGDEMRDDYALARYMDTLPHDTHVITTYWPLERALSLLADRDVSVLDAPPTHLGEHTVVVLDAKTQPQLCEGRKAVHTFGRYVVLEAGLPGAT